MGCTKWSTVAAPEFGQDDGYFKVELADSVVYLSAYSVTQDSLIGTSWSDESVVSLDRRDVVGIEKKTGPGAGTKSMVVLGILLFFAIVIVATGGPSLAP